MKNLEFLFDAYSKDHKNAFNQKVHLFCVPLIVYSIMGILWALSPVTTLGLGLNLAILFAGVISIYYLYLSIRLALIMIITTVVFFGSFILIEQQDLPLLYISIFIFVVAWIGQFYGHKVEGKKPSFLTDLTYLFIGPLWVVEKLLGRDCTNKNS
jgi:uncharacterized membrane protein YGL010W